MRRAGLLDGELEHVFLNVHASIHTHRHLLGLDWHCRTRLTMPHL